MVTDTGRDRRQGFSAIYLANCGSTALLPGSMKNEVVPSRPRCAYSEGRVTVKTSSDSRPCPSTYPQHMYEEPAIREREPRKVWFERHNI